MTELVSEQVAREVLVDQFKEFDVGEVYKLRFILTTNNSHGNYFVNFIGAI